jgi:AmpD protein
MKHAKTRTGALEADIEKGWLRGARRMPSPNCDARPDGSVIDLIVIHGISLPPGEFGGPWIDRLFTNELDPSGHSCFAAIAGLRVSAHLMIDRGGAVTQYVPFGLRAWHAGESAFCGRSACNDFSIGIELEGSDDIPYGPEQYREAARIVQSCMRAWPAITPERVVGHSDVAPGRKTDPGPAFDWAYFRSLLG